MPTKRKQRKLVPPEYWGGTFEACQHKLIFNYEIPKRFKPLTPLEKRVARRTAEVVARAGIAKDKASGGIIMFRLAGGFLFGSWAIVRR